jgi:hypothetical protein
VTIEVSVDGRPRTLEPAVVVVAGYTGADEAAVRRHVDELAAEGISPPPRVPMYWAMPPTALTQGPVVEVPGRFTSGEIELALVVDGDELYLAAGSDHTCRRSEAIDIRLSKLICPTPLSVDALRWSEVADHWARLQLSSTIAVDGGEPEIYQSAPAGANRSPQELLEGIPWASGSPPSSFVLLCGTVPAIGGIRPADRFDGAVTDPVSGRSISVGYDVRPVVELT